MVMRGWGDSDRAGVMVMGVWADGKTTLAPDDGKGSLGSTAAGCT